ncbi:MAG: B12-binding domain-containing radical SAM protein [Thermodesulfobacteriota bacterium]
MKTLFVSPRYPDTFWSLKFALQFSKAKATFPPLGLLTVAALLPEAWPKKLVDLNVEPLTEDHLAWADVVFLGAMTIQSASAEEIGRRCRRRGLKVVAGGPHFFHVADRIDWVDHLVIGEAEEIIPDLVNDLIQGRAAPVYRAERLPDLTLSPAPLWSLVDLKDYTDTSIQFTRGCPFNCEFCDVVLISGRRPRMKSPRRIIAELEALYRSGWRGEIMFVDDNFIGHKEKVKELLAAVGDWQKNHDYPFWFMTQVSLNLADDGELLALMSQADFKKVFVGIETTSEEVLDECRKHQNKGKDLIRSVRTLQRNGLEVLGGFIVGFDSDPPTIFEDQLRFIEEAGIPAAMVSLLSAPPDTPLWRRLEKEGRLLGRPSGDNAMDTAALNFIPRIGREKLIANYTKMIDRLYNYHPYYDRVLTFFRHYRPNRNRGFNIPTRDELKSLLLLAWRLGVQDKGRKAFWNFLGRVMIKHRRFLYEAFLAAACGHHFWRISRRFLARTDPGLH